MPLYNFLKRAIDLGICATTLVLTAPLCLVLMAAIRLESPGSPLFVQNRMGRGLRPFRMLKLRTMYADTEHVASHHVGQDRITRVGRVLRKLKLDELPQVLNVIGGSMSIVGPRPCLPSQTELIDARAARGLFAYRPGVTGPAQLQGVDMSEPVRLAEVEAGYFHRATLAGDFALMVRTVFGHGAGDAALRLRDR
jgi:lipopolysaccharide/colanic/teichoic acid biosynthesis glycosyltransferase